MGKRLGKACGHERADQVKENPDPAKVLEELDQRMEKLFDRWLLWKEQGAPGAEVPDGVYMNRIRQGMERLRQKMEEILPDEDYPENYYAPLPPKMEETYMADEAQIKRQAEEIWSAYQRNPDYQWLTEHYPAMKRRKNDKDYETAGKLLDSVSRLKSVLDCAEPLPIKREAQQRDLSLAFHLCRGRLEKKDPAKRKSADQKAHPDGQMKFEQLKAS